MTLGPPVVLALLLAGEARDTERAESWRRRADLGDLVAVLAEMREATDLEVEEQDLEVGLRERYGDFRGALDVLEAMPQEAQRSPERVRTRAHLLWFHGEYDRAKTLLDELAEGDSAIANGARFEADILEETVRSLAELRRDRTRLRWIAGGSVLTVILTLVLAGRASLRPKL